MPRLQKAEFQKDRKDALADYLSQELLQVQGDRARLEEVWIKQLAQARAQVPEGSKDFPWPGASNLVFPLTDMHYQPVYADFIQALHTPEDYWTPVAKRPGREDFATPLRKFLAKIDRNFLHMRRVNARALQDQNLLGTAIYKNHWLDERIKRRDYDPASGQLVDRVRRRTQPVIDHIPLQHFYIPANAWDIDPDAPVGAARWVAQKFYLTKAELSARANADPLLPGYDKDAVEVVLKFESTPDDQVDDKIREEAKYQPHENLKIELFEVWVRFDTDDDGIEEDVVVVFHTPSRRILRATHNPFLHGKRPFYATRYLPTMGFYGMGMAELDEWAQLTLTKLLNATIDNTLVANTRMYAGPLGMGIQPGEPIYPGKFWPLGPDEQIQEIRMGDIHASLPTLIGSFLQWGELRMGVNELRQGNITGLPSRTPATTVLSVLREGNKRFDMILNAFRDTHGEIGLRLLQNVAQSYRDDPTYWTQFCVEAVGEADAQKILQLFAETSLGELEASFGVQVTATSALVNKEAEKQSFIGMMQVIIPMYQQLVQTAMLMQQLPPGTPAFDTAAASYMAGVELIERMLERFDITNPSQYLGNMEVIANTLAAQSQGMNPATAGMMPGAGGGIAQAPYPAPGQGIPPGLGPAQVGALFGF